MGLFKMSKVYLFTARATTAEKVQFDKKDISVGNSGGSPVEGQVPSGKRSKMGT